MFKSMKEAYMKRFLKKTINTRIRGILFCSLALVIAGLLLSKCYGVALALVFVIAIVYLSAVFLYRKLESNMAYRHQQEITHLVDMTFEILDMFKIATSEITGKIKEHYELTNDSLLQLQNKSEKLEKQQALLIKSILPELGIVIQEEEDEEEQEKEWIQCDILGREIPILVFPDKVKRTLLDKSIMTYADLVQCSEQEFTNIPFFGLKSTLCLSALLEASGLHWEMKVKCEDDKWYYYNENLKKEGYGTNSQDDSE